METFLLATQSKLFSDRPPALLLEGTKAQGRGWDERQRLFRVTVFELNWSVVVSLAFLTSFWKRLNWFSRFERADYDPIINHIEEPCNEPQPTQEYLNA